MMSMRMATMVIAMKKRRGRRGRRRRRRETIGDSWCKSRSSAGNITQLPLHFIRATTRLNSSSRDLMKIRCVVIVEGDGHDVTGLELHINKC
jgi:hypothetical protein